MFVVLLTMTVAVDTQVPAPPIVAVPLPAAPPIAPVVGPAESKQRTATFMLFSTDDYPLAAIAKGEEGAVRVEVLISADGRVGECRILESSNSAALDVSTCAILRRRARYIPARDGMGRPTEDRQFVNVRWALEDNDPPPFISWADRTIVRLDARHQPVGCRYEYGSQGADLANCEAIYRLAAGALARPTDLPIGKQASLVFEHRFEANPTAAEAPTEVGKQLISRDVTEFEVSPKGKLEGCRSVIRQGFPGQDWCKSPFSSRFAPLAKGEPAVPRIGRMTAIVYAQWDQPH